MISDPGFRAARRAGSRGIGRLILPLVFLAFLGLIVQAFSPDGLEAPLPFLGVAGIAAAIVLFIFFTEVRRGVRNRGAWSRAARGAVSLTLRGEAVAKQRNVSGRPMRTVVVQHRGEQRYLHLLFAKDAPADLLRQGPVTVEFFAGTDVEGPARLLLPDGRTLWAFTTRLGERAETGPRSRAGRTPATSSDDGSAGLMVPAVMVGSGPHGDKQGRDRDEGRDQDTENDGYDGGAGDGFSDATWSGSDGWTGGGSWNGDSTWSGSDGGSGGGGWSGGDGGGWSGGDSGGGGGDSGGGGGS